VPNSIHRHDAQQIKNMGMNWVRLSHYPHDPAFIEAADELGILVLAEGPTWSHSGGVEWINNLEISYRKLIRRDRNHPSVFVWYGTVNHWDICLDRLYEAAQEEDGTRPLGQCDIKAPMCYYFDPLVDDGGICIEHTGGFTNGDRINGFAQAMKFIYETNRCKSKPDCSGTASWVLQDYNTFHEWNGGPDHIAENGILDLYG